MFRKPNHPMFGVCLECSGRIHYENVKKKSGGHSYAWVHADPLAAYKVAAFHFAQGVK